MLRLQHNGITFAGPNVSTFLTQNVMNNHANGLYLQPSTVVGTEGVPGFPNDNQWLGCTYATYSSSPANIFWVRNPQGTSYWPANAQIFGGGVSFWGTSGVSCFDCVTGVNCGFGGGNPNLSTALSVINDSTPFVSYPASSHWLYKHSLYRYLRTHDSLLSNNYVLHFRDSVRTSNMGMLDSINTVLADSNGVNSGDISAATNLSAAISSPDTIEQTSQTVDNIVIAMQSAHSNFPDSAQIAALQTIAPLCPAEYGNAVFVARALLSQVDTTHYISVCEMTVNNNNARVLGNQPINDTTISAKVYPNPANTELNIEVALQPGETARMCLYNSLGQEVECKDLTKNLTALPTKVFAEGLYYYRITNNSGNVLKEGRQMIVH